MKLFRLLVLAGIVSSASAEANKNSTLDFDAVTGATEIIKTQNGQGGSQAQDRTNKRRGGAGHDNIDKSYDTRLTAMKAAVIPKFKTYSFEDKTVGRTMRYNLFLPKDYKRGKNYPMVLFMPDASTVGKGAAWALEQGYGGIIWATEENQKKNPCIVLVPSFNGPDAAVNDNWETSDEVKLIPNLVEYIASN